MISFDVNNRQLITLSQEEHDGSVEVKVLSLINLKGDENDKYYISNGDFVMLLNYYKYIKDNDIQCDFINPNGKECL